MGREFPHHGNAEETQHPFITMSFLLASIAATVAIVSSLCGSLSRKKARSVSHNQESKENNSGVNIGVPSPTDDSPAKGSLFTTPTTTTAAASSSSDSENIPKNDEDYLQQPLPPPPGMWNLQTGTASHHFRSISTAAAASSSSLSSQLKKLPTSMSMRALGSGFGLSSRQASKRDHQENNNNMINHHNVVGENKKKHKKLKPEDSIWKKAIILGEKCQVPDDEDEDAIVYDEKGRRIETYHRKTTSMASSRQSSNIETDAIPSFDQGLRDETVQRSS